MPNNTKAINCLLVDDEPIARRVLKSHLAQLKEFAVAGECSSALEAFAFLRQQPVDLLLLDIQMPQLTGLELLRTLQQRPKVILVTAHREYALEGFELDVVDYLLKPVSFERFLKALNKYQQLYTQNAPAARAEEGPEYLYIRADRKTVKLVLSEVHYIESMSDYLKIYTKEGMLLTKETITAIEQKLPPGFIRIHRSFILNTAYLQAFTHESVEVDGKELPISRSFRQEVLERLGQ